MLDLRDKYYTSPQKVNISGKFVILNRSSVVLIFLVDSIEISGKEYTGTLPDTVLDPNHWINREKAIY
jgi:hypothetical protein